MITGGNRGLGRSLTLAALDAGHAVVATARGEHTLPAHERLTVLTLDVRDHAQAHRTVASAVDHLGRIDVLVNNAGYGLIGAVEEASEEDARSIVDTNLLGPLWLSQAVIPVMREQGHGHIVQVSTVGAVGTMPMLGLYNATKWGLEALSEAMAGEVSRFGIRVSLVEPGELDTDWAGSSMAFSAPLGPYDGLRSEMFGTAEVPWPPVETSSGTAPGEVADAILARVAAQDDRRLRVLVGDDSPAQVRAALDLRLADYALDPRFPSS
ncbi:short-chain alcohol dehydrogenase [Sanguibacter keddieii DSM 10542]|uniref:Short-chain alcohol dehydrogenase n=2 Tax=Sanguibacter keddieii TaxID=60920 RepID=D1BE72_SANKS|nr:short-chain alcohol dehydrogenase [Sanguibacter keddieii DSM 10542]